jgi:hypothetical protein
MIFELKRVIERVEVGVVPSETMRRNGGVGAKNASVDRIESKNNDDETEAKDLRRRILIRLARAWNTLQRK